PASHFTLGLEAYLQATSPIRRYSDLVNQRQLKSTLSNYYSYSEEDIQQIIQRTEYTQNTARLVTRARKNYWIFKYIQDLGKHLLPALVLNHFPNNRLLIQIHDELPPLDEGAPPYPHLYECTIPYRGKDKIPQGTWISVYIGNIDPRAQTMEVSFATILEVQNLDCFRGKNS
ncbi:MAG: RNB domain-containing ribonuclease, partial [Planctomycetota bacterium]